jgi:RNA polymerase sigma-70 factor (ECF subfamily)
MDGTSIQPELSSQDEAPPAEPARHADKEMLFRVLVAKHRARLQRFVMRHIGHQDDADDIAQQAFVLAAQTIERFRGESELSTWLYGIAMNLVRNYLNRAPHRVHRFESDEQLLEMPGAASENPREALSRRQVVQHLLASMEELPISMREVLMLVAIDELPYEDAAAILSVPVGTVRSRLSRARAALREKLAGMEIEEF